jgi:E3 ubiquitin-protein ligase HERC3
MNLQATFCSVSRASIFLTQEEKLVVFGKNDKNTLGIPPEATSPPGDQCRPVSLSLPLLPGERLLSVSCGCLHFMAFTDDQRVFTWGMNNKGQLGHEEGEDEGRPPALLEFSRQKEISRIACGPIYSAAITEDGKLYLWGDNSRGQLGSKAPAGIRRNRKWTLFQSYHSETPQELNPNLCYVHVDLPSPVVEVSCGHYHVLALTRDGVVYAWGKNTNGESGSGKFSDEVTPTLVRKLKNISRIGCGSCHCLALSKDGELYTWGWGGYGNLGIGNKENRDDPQLIFSDVMDFATGGSHVLVSGPMSPSGDGATTNRDH